MDDDQARAWLLLQQLPGLPRSLSCQLIDTYRDPDAILRLGDDELRAVGVSRRWLQARGRVRRLGSRDDAAQRADSGWRSLRAMGARLLPYSAPDYPALLREIPDPPPLLSICGDVALLSAPQLAMVGSRRCSRSAAETAHDFARELAAAGMVITSGLALGIDAHSHRGALAAAGGTVAVLGTGLDVVYPRGHRDLYREVAEHGVLISEFAPGSPPLPAQFPQRNRIISGLSLGVLVVEAALRSGSLITARQAMEQNREVFALPGSIHNPGSRGCHALIRQGAALVECVADIFAELEGWRGLAQGVEQSPAPGGEESSALLQLLGFEPTPFDVLQMRAGAAAPELQGQLVDLQLQGLVEQTAAGWQRSR